MFTNKCKNAFLRGMIKFFDTGGAVTPPYITCLTFSLVKSSR